MNLILDAQKMAKTTTTTKPPMTTTRTTTTTTTPKITTIKPTPFNWFTSEPTTIKTTTATDNPFLIFASTTGANNIILPSTLANAVENNIDAGLFSSLGGQVLAIQQERGNAG